jgi:hypothetical protein
MAASAVSTIGTPSAGAVVALLSTAVVPGPAHAAGCLKGAMVGGTAGHFAGHHGLLGAGAGCLVGRHQANKKARQQMNSNTNTGSSTDNSNHTR